MLINHICPCAHHILLKKYRKTTNWTEAYNGEMEKIDKNKK